MNFHYEKLIFPDIFGINRQFYLVEYDYADESLSNGSDIYIDKQTFCLVHFPHRIDGKYQPEDWITASSPLAIPVHAVSLAQILDTQ